MGGSAKFDSPKIFGGLNMVQLFDVNEQNWLDIRTMLRHFGRTKRLGLRIPDI